MESFFADILKYFNFIYIFMCNVITYVIIMFIPKDPSTGWKRVISAVVAVVTGILFIMVWHVNKEAILCSFFVQFLMYDYVIKEFLRRFGGGQHPSHNHHHHKPKPEPDDMPIPDEDDFVVS